MDAVESAQTSRSHPNDKSKPEPSRPGGAPSRLPRPRKKTRMSRLQRHISLDTPAAFAHHRRGVIFPSAACRVSGRRQTNAALSPGRSAGLVRIRHTRVRRLRPTAQAISGHPLQRGRSAAPPGRPGVGRAWARMHLQSCCGRPTPSSPVDVPTSSRPRANQRSTNDSSLVTKVRWTAGGHQQSSSKQEAQSISPSRPPNLTWPPFRRAPTARRYHGPASL